jgi:hypothetical protein
LLLSSAYFEDRGKNFFRKIDNDLVSCYRLTCMLQIQQVSSVDNDLEG